MTGCVPPPPHPSPSPDPPPVAPPLAFRTFPRSASRFRFRRNLWPRLSRSRSDPRALDPRACFRPRLDPRSPSPLRSPSSPLPSRRFTLGAAASSNWRETAKTRERARSAETELASAHETIRSLQAKAIARETRLGGEKRELAAEHKRLEERLKETERRHDARVRQVQSAADAKYAALAEKHARLREEHAALQTAVGRAGGGARGATDLETDVETERGASHAAALERQAHVMRAEAARSYDQLETAKERRIANLKQQSEYFLKRKDDEIRALRAEASRSERARREEVERLTESCEYLRTWALAMNVVLKRVEDGSYAIREGDGLRRLVIPAKDKPAALDVETLKRRAFAANAFARERGFTLPNDDKATREGPEEEDQLGFAEDDPLGYVGAAETMKPTTTKRLGDDASDTPAPDDDQASIDEAEKANDANDASTRHRHLYPGDTFELEAFRTHGRLIDEERRAVQEATLKELSAHPTVEYIRRLEEENARIQRALSRERRSVSDMRVALNAARRAQQESALEFARATRGRGSAAMGGPSAFHSASSERRGAVATRLVGESAVAFGAHAETKPGDPTAPEFRATEGSARVVTHQGLTAVGTARPASASLGYPGGPGGLASSSGRASNAFSSTIPRSGVSAASREVLGYLGEQKKGALANDPHSDATKTHHSLPGSRNPSARSRAKARSEARHKNRSRSLSTSPSRAPLGGAAGRRRDDRVPIAGRPLSGSREVGYGFVLGDGPDSQGGTVGWPAGSEGARGAALSDRDWSRASSARAGARASATEQDYRYTDAYQSVAEEKRGPGARRPCAPPPALPTIEASGAAV